MKWRKMLDILKCPLCFNQLRYNYQNYTSTLVDISKIKGNYLEELDNIIESVLCFICMDCGKSFVFTYKDLENLIKKSVLEKVNLSMLGNMDIEDKIFYDYFTYCGVCNGMDGNGNCKNSIYQICEYNKLPV